MPTEQRSPLLFCTMISDRGLLQTPPLTSMRTCPLANPNRFTLFHWTLSALGLCMCLGVMFLSNWYYAIAALGIAAAIYKYIEFKG